MTPDTLDELAYSVQLLRPLDCTRLLMLLFLDGPGAFRGRAARRWPGLAPERVDDLVGLLRARAGAKS
jgi:hypothetical protein